MDRRPTEEQTLRRALVAEKHAQATALLPAHGLDCWLTFSREGSDLLLPYVMGGEELVGTAALMLFADGPTVAIVADYDVGQVEDHFETVLPYSLDWQGPLREILNERKPARIGINFSEHDHGTDGLTHGLFLALIDALEPIGLAEALTTAEPVAAAVRATKTPAELERLRRAGEITQRIFEDITGMLKPGLTETEIAEIFRERMQTYEVGPAWEAAYCPSVFSSRSAGGHHAPGTTRIERGDGLRVDFGVRSEGYCSDLQRTWYLLRPGETAPPADFVRAFDTVHDGIRLAAETLRPGVTGQVVDAAARDPLAARGYTFTHALGHQLGRLAHDGGLLLGPDNARYGARSGGLVEAGMVFTLEPCVGPIGLEENVVVTETGCEFLVDPQEAVYLV